jgi:hypothetical protein
MRPRNSFAPWLVARSRPPRTRRHAPRIFEVEREWGWLRASLPTYQFHVSRLARTDDELRQQAFPPLRPFVSRAPCPDAPASRPTVVTAGDRPRERASDPDRVAMRAGMHGVRIDVDRLWRKAAREDNAGSSQSASGHIVLAFALCGLAAGPSGVMLAGYATKAYQGMGDAYLLAAIAAVVIGGTNILGGRAAIWARYSVLSSSFSSIRCCRLCRCPKRVDRSSTAPSSLPCCLSMVVIPRSQIEEESSRGEGIAATKSAAASTRPSRLTLEQRFGFPLIEVWGMTEMLCVLPDRHRRRRGPQRQRA